MSHLDRSSHLFSCSPWLPLREHEESSHFYSDEGESVNFTTLDHLNLRGTWFHQKSDGPHRGTVLYLHELNGNRWSVLPFLEKLRCDGFDIFTFDQRGHGESDTFEKFHQTPWVTPLDLEDITSAVDFISSREKQDVSKNSGTDTAMRANIGVFGLGKGATLALCCASLDDRVGAVVMDSPAPEDRLYEKNCYHSFMKSGTILASRRFTMFVTLMVKSLVFLVACPFFTLFSAWRRFMMSLWCGGKFVNTWSIVKKIRKPIMILHGDMVSCVSLAQIHAFSHRMKIRPKIWFTRKSSADDSSNDEAIAKQLSFFFSRTLHGETSPSDSGQASSPSEEREHAQDSAGERFYRRGFRFSTRKPRSFSFAPRRA